MIKSKTHEISLESEQLMIWHVKLRDFIHPPRPAL